MRLLVIAITAPSVLFVAHEDKDPPIVSVVEVECQIPSNVWYKGADDFIEVLQDAVFDVAGREDVNGYFSFEFFPCFSWWHVWDNFHCVQMAMVLEARPSNMKHVRHFADDVTDVYEEIQEKSDG
jgi:hypothetical protein